MRMLKKSPASSILTGGKEYFLSFSICRHPTANCISQNSSPSPLVVRQQRHQPKLISKPLFCTAADASAKTLFQAPLLRAANASDKTLFQTPLGVQQQTPTSNSGPRRDWWCLQAPATIQHSNTMYGVVRAVTTPSAEMPKQQESM